MFKPISLFIGLRYTRAKRSNNFISFISLVSILGLTLGVAVLITVMSVMNGFDRELKNRVLGMVPHATISSDTIIQDWQPLLSLTRNNPHVVAAAPFTQIQGMLTANGQVAGIMLYGIEPSLEQKVSIINNHIVQGDFNNLKQGEFGIVLGQDMADNLGLRLNDKITLVLPEASASPAGIIPRFKRFTLVGIFKVGAEVDSMLGYIALNDASTLLRLPAGAQGIRLKLDDLFAAPMVASELSNTLSETRHRNYYPSDWTSTHGNLFSAIQMEKTMVGLLLFLIVIVAAFNIVSSLVMVVTDKKADIAILRTLGASKDTITKIFMVQGLMIGWLGTLAGAILGIVLSLTVGHILDWINNLFSLHLFDAYFVHYLPTELKWGNVALIVISSFVLCFFVTVYPARRAAAVQPAEALRYE